MLRWRPKSAPSRKRATSRKRVRGARPQPLVNAYAGVDFTHRSECSAGVPKAPLPANGRPVANESGAPAHNHLSMRTRVSISLIAVNAPLASQKRPFPQTGDKSQTSPGRPPITICLFERAYRVQSSQSKCWSVPGFLSRQDDIRRKHLFRIDCIENVVATAEFAVDLDVAALFND